MLACDFGVLNGSTLFSSYFGPIASDTIVTSIENANDYVMMSRKQKVNNRWENVDVKQPKAIVNRQRKNATSLLD